MLLGGLAALGFRPYEYDATEPQPFYMIARPGFFGGFGSFLDLFSPISWNYVNFSGLDEANAVSVYTDWLAVGSDLVNTIEANPPESLRTAA
jgi:hypothetical protein